MTSNGSPASIFLTRVGRQLELGDELVSGGALELRGERLIGAARGAGDEGVISAAVAVWVMSKDSPMLAANKRSFHSMVSSR